MIKRVPVEDVASVARHVRAIVEAKESMAWPCQMEALSFLFGFHQLSPKRCTEIASALGAEGVLADPLPLPTNATKSVLLYVAESNFALGWRT